MLQQDIRFCMSYELATNVEYLASEHLCILSITPVQWEFCNIPEDMNNKMIATQFMILSEKFIK